MTAYGRADVKVMYGSVKFGKLRLDHVGDRTRVIQAVGVADEGLARVVIAVPCELVHERDDAPLGLGFGADLLLDGEGAVGLDVHHGTDLKHAAHDARHLRDASPTHEEAEVRREKPVLNLVPVYRGPRRQVIQAHASAPELGHPVYEEPVAR